MLLKQNKNKKHHFSVMFFIITKRVQIWEQANIKFLSNI